ncbi:hypothetical protein BN59_01866 [Legionella massiliensis]|uniref:F-box domain-containing protein n=1 Tax=Legionella massiliensis TaxID=1034943 RepID=A0A078KX20_9GAMM|nr:hypothetical protein [Legionella massiliensis]CDZ77582.1 hypothetical protein BN59_01866 [Legionella massiliensis]CEE13320.1 hypothetical protein BN1094_01866 [Legionella massiliensis]
MPIKNENESENENKPGLNNMPDELIIAVLDHLNNQQLKAVGRVHPQFSRDVNTIAKARGFTTENMILPNQTYYILGNTVDKAAKSFFSFYYDEARKVPNKEIKEAVPKPNQIVSVFRTKEEADTVSASHVDYDPISSAAQQVVFAVKLKDNQAVEVEFKQDQSAQSNIKSAKLPSECFKIISGYNPRTNKEVKIAKENCQVSPLSFFKKVEQTINDALAGNQHRPNQPK